ncbi:MAG: Clp protease N-terminal domain-containing protein, partial [Candidatus Falkowbacteria bacterium]|nr:Clp protease N-terminal domain-containing protein [Candidatus Falkowbacteria bacterium]
MPETKENLPQFIEAPQFKAYGCWWSKTFLYCELNLKPVMAAIKKSKNHLDKLVNFICYVIAFAGWLALAYWFFRYGASFLETPGKILFFWKEKHILMLFFLLSLWFDLFLIYRRSEQRAKEKKINYKYFQDLIEKPTPQAVDNNRKFNVATVLNEESLSVFQEAYSLASKLDQPEVRVIHLFRALLRDKTIQNLFIRLKVDAKKLVAKVDKHLIDP